MGQFASEMVLSTQPQGIVSCSLCQAAVSVRAGNLDKFKVHVESDHDVFYDHDILIALNFLYTHEKEVIIETAIPRMRMMFEDVNTLKRQGYENKKTKYETEAITGNGIEIQDELKNEVPNAGAGRVTEFKREFNDERLTENSNCLSDVQSEFSTCDVCHQPVRNSLLFFHQKTHLSGGDTNIIDGPKMMVDQKMLVDPRMAECPKCNKTMLRTSMWKHKSRCNVMKGDAIISEQPPKDKYAEQNTSCIFTCKICFTSFPKQHNLKWHTTEEHGLDLQDVEEMMSEISSDSLKNPELKTESLEDTKTLKKEIDVAERTVNEANFQDEEFDPQDVNKYMDIADGWEEAINSLIESVDVGLWCCKVCGKQYSSKNKSGLKGHVESNHAKRFKHGCKICHQKYSTKQSLQHHIRRHSK